MALSLRYAVRSERGLVRSNNEDAAFAGPRLLALADGMGGHAAGEVASSLAIAELASLNDREPGEDLLPDLSDAIARANASISQHVAEHPGIEGMGTTLTAILFAGDRIGLAHVGDSRAYLLRDGDLSQVTKDETFVQSLIDAGRLTPEEAWTHPQRSVVLRAMMGQDLDPSMVVREVRPSDRYLICSDGLSDFVPAETIAETLRDIANPQHCVQQLVRLALRADSHDNVTCVVADVVDGDCGYDLPLVTGSAGRQGALIRP
jgi:PPM family protein phosphatase